jgi:hypothetical protein
MVLGLRSSEREKEREKERIREHTSIHTGHRIGQEKYSRYNNLTLAPRHMNYCSINTGG